jgi:hypothetical protein
MARVAFVWVVLSCACGPTLGTQSTDETSSSGLASSSNDGVSGSTDGESDPRPTSTASTITTTGDDDDGGGITFIDPDGGFCAPLPDSGSLYFCECHLWQQDCPRGQKCAPWANDGSDAWNTVKCTPIDPNPAPIGAPCVVEGGAASGIDSCELAALCWNVDPATLEGECVAFCTGNEGSPSCDDPHSSCTILNFGTLILCLPTCDPLGDDCENGFACRPNAPSGSTASNFVCLPTEADGTIVDGCEAHGGCPDGHACVGSDVLETCAQSCCARYCDHSDPLADEACGADEGYACVPMFGEGMAPQGHANVGVCGPS